MVEVLQSFLQFPRGVVGFSPCDVAFNAGRLGGQDGGGVVGGLVVVAQPPLAPTQVEQQVDVDLGEGLIEALLLLQRDPFQGVSISVGCICQLILSVQYVSVFQ